MGAVSYGRGRRQMRQLDPFWQALETTPGLARLPCEWRERIGAAFPKVERFLRPTSGRSRSYPCPGGGEECPRKVVEHGPGDIVAVCGNSPRLCDTIPLTAEDLLIYEVDFPSLAEALAAAFGLEPRFRETELAKTWQIGLLDGAERRLEVFLTIQLEGQDFEVVVAKLLTTEQKPFILLAPTSYFLASNLRQLLQAQQCACASLEDLVGQDDDGRLTATASLTDLLPEAVRPPVEEENVFLREGEGWTITFQGETVVLRKQKGLTYLAVLLANPGRQYTLEELTTAAGESPPATGIEMDGEEGLGKGESALRDPVLDAHSLRSIQQAREHLQEDLREAIAGRDLERQESLRKEIKMIREYEESASARGRRSRLFPNESSKLQERMRTAIRRSRKRIEENLPALAAHLTTYLHSTGYWSYQPEPPVSWKT